MGDFKILQYNGRSGADRDQPATGRSFHEALYQVEQIYVKEMMPTDDATEGLNAFMEKREPVWKNR